MSFTPSVCLKALNMNIKYHSYVQYVCWGPDNAVTHLQQGSMEQYQFNTLQRTGDADLRF